MEKKNVSDWSPSILVDAIESCDIARRYIAILEDGDNEIKTKLDVTGPYNNG